MNLKDKTVLWVDNGLFHSFARRVAPEFGRNYYYTPWQSGFPSQKQTRLGEGFPELERVNYPQEMEDAIDLFVFLDLFQSDWQIRLEKQGKRVWGARHAEDVELKRWDFRTWCRSQGFPLATADRCKGGRDLAGYLGAAQDVFVKLADGTNRGDMETRLWKDKALGTPWLDQLLYDLGVFKTDTEFLLEKKMENIIELGEDGFTVDGQWPDHMMQGMEIKGLGTVGVVKPYQQLPLCLRGFNARLAEVFKADRARTFFCMEGLYNQKKQFFPMDPCMRLGSPSNELLQEMFSGWGQTLWDGADGRMTSPTPTAKWGIVAMVYNETSGKNWQPLQYPPAVDRWVKLRNPYALAGTRYAVPQGSPTNIAGVVGVGNTFLDAARAMAEHARAIDGNQVEIATDALAKMVEVIGKCNAWGATFSTEKLPSAGELKAAIG